MLLFPHVYFHCSLNLHVWPIVLHLFYFSFNRSASAAYKEDVRGETLLGELRRQYHCAAYNCLVSIISCTQTVLKFYTGLLFAENPAKVEHDFWYENKIKSDLICFMNQSKTLNKKLLTCLRIDFSHLKEHKFKHNFQDSVDPLCSCGNDIESTVHFFLHSPNFTTQRRPFWTN